MEANYLLCGEKTSYCPKEINRFIARKKIRTLFLAHADGGDTQTGTRKNTAEVGAGETSGS